MSITSVDPLTPPLLPAGPAHVEPTVDVASANRPFGLTHLVLTAPRRVHNTGVRYDVDQQLTVNAAGEPVTCDMAGVTTQGTVDTTADMQTWPDVETDND